MSTVAFEIENFPLPHPPHSDMFFAYHGDFPKYFVRYSANETSRV